MLEQTRYLLPEEAIPTSWYNLAADLPKPPPPVLHPGTQQPIGPEDLAPLFPMAVIGQEVSPSASSRSRRRCWRSTGCGGRRRCTGRTGWSGRWTCPRRVRIFYKYEGGSPAGSHKPNTAVPQAYYAKQEGVKRIATETGAGQWGSALALAGSLFGLEIKVYMVKISYAQKPYRRALMETWGAQCVASPSTDTNAGRTILAQDPDSTGSLGIAISEAVEDAATREDTKYALGSVLNHVLLHQTVIGQEAQQQLEMADAYPDVVIGCVGGGSNFAGISFPFVRQKLAGKSIRIVAAEPAACPTLTRGTYAYDFGDTGQLTPLVKMHTLGHTFVPAGIHAGGLRYHGAAPLVSMLLDEGLIEATAIKQRAAFEAAVLFARTEGIVPAPEPSHAIRVAIDEALQAKEAGEARTILFNLCGHGFFDLSAYDSYLSGSMQDYEHPQSEIEAALAGLPSVAE